MQYVVIVIVVLVAGYLLFGLIGTAAAFVVHFVDRMGFGVASVLSPGSEVNSLNIAAWALVGAVIGIVIGLYRGLKSVNRDKMAAPAAVVVGVVLGIGLGIAGPSVEEYGRGSWARSASSSTQSSSSQRAPQPPPAPPPPPLEPCVAARDPARGEPLTAALKLIEKKTARPADTDNFVAAEAQAERATSLDPRCAEAYSVLAFARFRAAYRPCSTGGYASAEAAGRRALELATDNPTRAAGQRNLARAAAAAHQWAESMRLFRASIEAGGANTDAQSWLDDLELIGSFRPTFVSAAAGVLKGEKLDESHVADLTAKESSWLLNAVLARNGRQLNRAVQDWFFFCTDSPLAQETGGSMPSVVVAAVRNPVKKGTVDWDNMQLLGAHRRAAKGGDLASQGDDALRPNDQPGSRGWKDPFEASSGSTEPAGNGAVEAADLQGAWSGELKGGGQIKLIVEDVSGRMVQATATTMTDDGQFDTLKLRGSLDGKSLVLQAEDGSRLSVKYKGVGARQVLAGNWQMKSGQKLPWTGKKR
jgi:hypothetical protein